jgi:hypothetical protein
MKSRLESDKQQTAQFVYSIPREGGRSFLGETGRPVALRVCEHWHSLKMGILENQK